jgi:hypothetical protein
MPLPDQSIGLFYIRAKHPGEPFSFWPSKKRALPPGRAVVYLHRSDTNKVSDTYPILPDLARIPLVNQQDARLHSSFYAPGAPSSVTLSGSN